MHTLPKTLKLSDEVIDALSIDCVIFGFKDAELYVLLVKHGQGRGTWALPGSWIKSDESLNDAANRILSAQTSVGNIFLEQFKAYGEVNRYAKKRVITIAFYALVNIEEFELVPGLSVTDLNWFMVNNVPEMSFDHGQIFEECFSYLKHKVQHEPIGFNLLPEKFTLLQLQELYEAILSQKLDKSNFRRKFSKMNLLVSCNEKQQDVSHRAAMLYRFDEDVYNRLIAKGFNFEI